MSLLPVGFGSAADDYGITDSLRFRSSASGYLSRTFASAGNRKTWTFSFWSKTGTLTTYRRVFSTVAGGSQFYFRLDNNDQFTIESAGTVLLNSTSVYRDPSAWYHFLITLDTTQATASNRLKVYVNGTQVTAFDTANYPALNSDHQWNNNVAHYISGGGSGEYFDGYVTEANFIDGQALTPTDFGEYDDNGTWKPLAYTGTYGNNGFYLPMKPTTQAELQNTVLYAGNTNKQSIDGVGYAPDLVWIKNRTGANNHYLYDTVRGTDRSLLTNATNADNVGAQQLTSFDTDGFTVPYDVSGYNNYAGRSYVAWTWDAGDNQTSTGISSVLYVGQGAAGHSVKGFGFSPDFVWIKNRTGSAQNHMLFDSVRGANLRLQSDSNATEFNQTNSLISFDADGFSLGTSTGNLNVQNNNYIAWGWDAGDGDPVSNTDGDITSTVKANDATGFSIVSYTGDGSASSTVGHGLSSSAAMLIVKDRAVANNWRAWHKDLSANHWMYLNLTNAQASGATDGGIRNVNATTFGFINGSTAGVEAVNTNGRNYIAYAFSEVSGVSKFGSYSGTGSAGNAITGLGFKPGFLMIKRTDTTGNWIMLDSTRDPFNSVDSSLVADGSSAETANNAAIAIDFNSDGFTIQGTGNGVNNSSGTYIYMAFKGSYSDYVSPLNDTGTIDSRVKANPSKGFSIVSYEGNGSNSTIGHGLSSAPEFFFLKNRDTSVNDWIVYQSDVGATKFLRLNQTNATTTQTNIFNNTAPTSSVFTVGTNSAVNSSGVNYIAYCFAEVAGYSKFDSYTGTGSAGNSITTGFRPAWLMVKRIDSAGGWCIHDNTRNPNNPRDLLIRADTSAAETTGGNTQTDFTSNGFTLQTTNTDMNANGGTYIYMAFAETADAVFNFDASGNKNNFDANNINSNAESETTYDLMKDTPSLVDENAGNFAVLNPLDDPRTYVTYSDANLTVTNTTSNAHSPFISTIGMAPNSGKYYWESIGVGNSNTRNATGIGTAESMGSTTLPVGFISNQAGLYIGSGTAVYFYDESGTSTFNVAWAAGNVFMHCYDANTGKFWVGQNGVWYNSSGGTTGDPATGTNPTATLTSSNTYFPLGTVYNNSGSYLYYNFGQRPFAYTPPTGFLKLNTFNLPDSTIEDGSDYFTPVLYTGNGATNHNITGVGFQPDWVWLKERSSTSFHQVLDAVRGAGIRLETNSTGVETTPSPVGLSSFDSDGFTVENNNGYNQSSQTYVAWNWKANGSGVSNNVGSIPSTVSVNTTAGFSIVSWSGNSTNGATIGHGLGTAPNIILTKCRSHATSWIFGIGGMSGFGVNDYLNFQTTGTKLSSTTFYQGYSANTFQVGVSSADEMNKTGRTYISYVFSEVPGYSAFGSYTGNTSTDGPFIYTGFRPAWVMLKRTDAAGHNWFVLDATRNSYNVLGAYLNPNTANAEASTTFFDFTSNGFKLRATSSGINTGTIIYMAFAENPFKNANAR